MKALNIIALAVIACGPALAIQCGSIVAGSVTLSADLICQNQTALIIGASNTTINLNGHTISCQGAGFLGTCQNLAGAPPGALPNGIASSNFDNVNIQGPGTIFGYGYGINISGGSGHIIHGVLVTGPTATLVNNLRGQSVGIQLSELKCGNPLLPERTTAAAMVSFNTVKHHLVGILLANSGCAQVFGNVTTENNGKGGNAHGIAVAGGDNNTIYRNTVMYNGLNRTFDSGITLSFAYQNSVILPSTHTIVTANQVTNNCGDGIVNGTNSNNNNIASNTAKYNGKSASDGRCDLPKPGTFHDLAQFGGISITWNPNNICNTQTANIPAGVCNINE